MKQPPLLTVSDVARLLNVPPVTVQRWAHQGKIPCKLRERTYVFKQPDIYRWAREHDLRVREISVDSASPPAGTDPDSILVEALNLGGVHYDLKADDVYTALRAAVDRMKFLSAPAKEDIFNQLLDREEIASTAIGGGVALPHPRRPVSGELAGPVVAFFALESPIEFHALDGKPVSLFFIILSRSTREHLRILSALSLSLRNPRFRDLLDGQPALPELAAAIKEIAPGPQPPREP